MPYQGTYQPLQTARAVAALPGAGAFDANPTELACIDFDFATLFFEYTRGAAGGAFDVRIEYSPYSQAPASGEEWFDASALAVGTVTPGADTTSTFQRERLSYGSQGAAAETVVIGPLEFGRTIERMRISAAESGVVGTPGDLGITVLFSKLD